MMEFFSTLLANVRRPGTAFEAGCLPSRDEDADMLSHPEIARMDLRQLADLPFPRPGPEASYDEMQYGRKCGSA